MNPEQNSSGSRYRWPSAPLGERGNRSLDLIESREERGHRGILKYEDLRKLSDRDLAKWPDELKAKVERVHDLFAEELRESRLEPHLWLFPK